MGRPLLLEREGIAPVHYEYDGQGRLEFITQGTGNQERTQHFSYQHPGVLNIITDSLQQNTNFTSDNTGFVTSVTRPDDQDVNFVYDAKGNTLGVTPAGKTEHQFEMSPVDLVESYLPPALSTETNVDTIYTYNLDKDLTQIIRPDNKSIIYNYNPSKGLLASVTIPARTYNLAYDANSGQLNHIDWSSSDALDYSYDGFLPTSETWSGIIAGSLGFDYDNDFKLVQLNINQDVTIPLTYDNDSLLIQAGDLILNRNSNSGFIESLDLANTQTVFSYNDFGELASQTETSSGNQVYSASFIRDNIGRIISKTEKLQNGKTTEYRYEYDVVGRLENVYIDNKLTDSYSYDSNGNRLSHNDISATYDAQDRMLTYGTVSYSYNANGDLTSKTDSGITTTYQYDAMGNLLKVTLPGDSIIEYLVDGQNRRIGKKLNGNLVQGFLYQDQLNPVAELNPDNSIKSLFVYADKGHVPAYMKRNDTNYKFVTDYLGSVRLVINTSTGVIEQQMDYDAFGKVISDSNPGFQPFGYAGGLYEPASGLVRFGVRDYDAEVGRWTAKDPIRFDGGQGNLYGYVNNDPINFIDPDGRLVFLIPLIPVVITGTDILIGAGILCIISNCTQPVGEALSDYANQYNENGDTQSKPPAGSKGIDKTP